MPLLKRQPFVRKKPPANIRPDEDVFHCEMTNEIFRDYEEFFERVIVCNSLVWTCSITGRPGLTYQEALESEEKALKHLATFPIYLQRPILYLASKTRRSRLSDMNDDVFVFAKDRYFVGEKVDVVNNSEKYIGTSVIKVIPPKTGETEVIVLDSESEDDKPLKPKDSSANIKAEDFRYIVRFDDGKQIEVRALDVSRKKGLYTRDKSKLFLKQNCEVVDGIWKVKNKVAQKHTLNDMVFQQFFPIPTPTFNVSLIKKKINKKSISEDDKIKKAKMEKTKKKDQEKKNEDSSPPKPKKLTAEEREAFLEEKRKEKEAKKQATLAERLAKREELQQKMKEERERRKVELQQERDKLKEEKRIREECLKEWSRPRDDMECDDLKILPTPNPVQTNLSPELFGEAILLLEFCKIFDTILDMEDHFPDGLDFETLERALIDTDTKSPFTDLCEAFLSTIISLQEEEDAEEGEQTEEIGTLGDDFEKSSKSMTQLIQAATVASQWCHVHQGLPLKKLTFDSMTLSEILRLHFLSSGARGSASSAKFRYQQRGGYTALDDPGMELKIQEPGIMKLLSTTSVFDIAPGEKLRILSALTNQILTYAATRDLIDDNWEKMKQAKMDLKQYHWAEHKREKDEATARYKKRMEERAKEKAKEEEKKAQKKKEMEEKLKSEEGGDANSVDVDIEMKDNPEEKTPDKASVSKKPKKDAPKGKKENEGPDIHVRTRKQAAVDEELRQQIEEGANDIDESKLSPEEHQQWKQKLAEKGTKRKEEFHEKAQQLYKEILNIQNGFSIYPIGMDRIYRRFWLFDSVPGVFVEDNDEYVPDCIVEPVPQSSESSPFISNNLPAIGKCKVENEEKSSASDKENESFDGSMVKLSDSNVKVENPLGDKNLSNGNTESEKPPDLLPTGTEAMDVDDQKSMLPTGGIIPERVHMWAYYSTQQEIHDLIESLNPRGYREGALKQALSERRALLENVLDNKNMPEFLQSGEKNSNEDSKDFKGVQNLKSRNRATRGYVKNSSAQEFMELNLREMLLDMEERIYAGSLGVLKVNDRVSWRDAIERGSYDAQSDAVTWIGKANSESTEEHDGDVEDVKQVVRDLAQALLQITQGIEPKYLSTPLGESEEARKIRQKAAIEATRKEIRDDAKKLKKKEKAKDDEEEDEQPDKDADSKEKEVSKPQQKTILERWEESLMSSTSLSQVFLHLSTLETCIAWSKSALNARCRLCRRKGDAEKMLLCDGCDRGHHMYCLKPPVKQIPQGDWFCPDCRPKETRRSPRKIRRKSFVDGSESEEESEEESEQEEEDGDSSEQKEESEDDDEDNSDDGEEESDDNDESDDEEPAKPAKVSMIKALRKKQPASGRSTPSSVRSSSRARNSPAESRISRSATKRVITESNTSRSSSRAGKRRSELNNSRPSSRQGKRAYSTDDDSDDSKHQTTKSRGGDTSATMKMAEKLVYEIVDHDDSWPFLKPVSKREAPDYYEVIKKPMDLSTIRANINAYRYDGPSDILEDMRLLFSNCEKYNLPTAEEYQCGTKLCKLFEKRVKELKIESKSSTPSNTKRSRRR